MIKREKEAGDNAARCPAGNGSGESWATGELPIHKPAEDDLYIITREIVSGNTERFEEIVERFRMHVYQMAWKVTANYDDALDITQEVFLRTYRALSAWKGQSKFSTWLHRIALNTTIDYLRRNKRHVQALVRPAEEENENRDRKLQEGVTHETPARALELKELRCAIYSAVVKLPSRQRKSFVLRHYYGLPIKEIAEILRCSEGTIKRHLYRAIQRMRTLLKG
jgi:RNA polymerase sigma-70 factor (ECF subfamily)